MRTQCVSILLLLGLAATVRAADQKPKSLVEFSGALERLAATVAPAVVQVQVSAWCGPESAENAGTLTSCHVVGSGVIVDPSGYIITNEHVVRNARRIRVMLTPKTDGAEDGAGTSGKQPVLDTVVAGANRDPIGKRAVLDAVVVGSTREADLALLKIDASGLPAIPLDQSGKAPRQGQLVLAVGSPEGLDNTMTVGIISAVGRQPSPDFPMLYIQTDAAINPGNSGGPLLNMEGELIGINTFVITDSGRNQGLGFAVPAAVVRYAYQQLRSHGAVRYSLVGVRVQTITLGLALGLGLSRGYGVMISDVLPGSPAEEAGLRAQDILAVVDGASISALPYYAALMYLHDPALPVAVTVLRGQETLQFLVPSVSVDDQVYAEASIDPHEGLISELGIFGKAVTPALARRNGLRSKRGIYVAATTPNEGSAAGLAAGDVISSFNGVRIASMEDLRTIVHQWTSAQPAVLQVERNSQYMYLERDLEEGRAGSAGRR